MCLFLNCHVTVGTLLNPLHFMGISQHHLLFYNQWRVTRSTWMLYVMLCLWLPQIVNSQVQFRGRKWLRYSNMFTKVLWWKIYIKKLHHSDSTSGNKTVITKDTTWFHRQAACLFFYIHSWRIKNRWIMFQSCKVF